MRKWFILVLTCCTITGMAQFVVRRATIVSGPMIGHVELRTAVIWLEAGYPDELFLRYSPVKKPREKWGAVVQVDSGTGHYILRFLLDYLEPGSTYNYEIFSHRTGERVVASGTVTPQPLWQWRKPAPDFSFLAGSCAYFNQPQYDRPGTPYGSDSVIFEAMAKERSDFMLWLGDNWYTREVDFFSPSGLYYRASHDRSTQVLQPLLKAMPQYAIWDDHDYGWDNADKSFPLKEVSRKVFNTYWCNPSAGENGEGIYTRVTWNDVDVFMLDDRWFRSNDEMPDSVNDQPNKEKRMFGPKQLEWLKNALLQSNHNANISFRIIATGSQVLNAMSPKDCLFHYPAEYRELMDFLKDNDINGVLFLTGDRHHSEIIKMDRTGSYPLYDITASSFTAGISVTRGAEKANPMRVSPEIDEYNYARISFTGNKQDRRLTVTFLDKYGKKLADWSVALKDVSVNRR